MKRMAPAASSSWTLTARWVFPVAGPPLERGVVAVADDKTVAVEPHGRLAADLDLGDAAVLPGLVNAHTHLDLSGMRGLAPPPPHFTDWLRQVISYRRNRPPEQVAADTRAGLAESLCFGTTLLGDISGDGGSWDALAGAPLRAVVFREMLGLPEERVEPMRLAATAWLRAHAATKTCRPGVSPHAPYSVHVNLLMEANEMGQEFHVPVATHLAEWAAELELLHHHSGPFVAFLQDLGVWEPEGLVSSEMRALRHCCRHNVRTLFAHGNYLPPTAVVPQSGTLIYCPRTHAAFGHPPHPFREFLARGVRIAVGTDSLASNPDLDVLAEIRFLHQRHPDVPGATLLRMATLSGAEALGWDDETGSLAPGKSADLVVAPLPPRDDADPHRLVLASDRPVARVLFRGRWVVP
jgi:cytosine/adenosine deaminase-related metal-dependent hydrolase